MAEHDFKVGDVVQHKTGNIKMIYIGDGFGGDALCEWTDPSGKPRRETFAYAALQHYQQPESKPFNIGRA